MPKRKSASASLSAEPRSPSSTTSSQPASTGISEIITSYEEASMLLAKKSGMETKNDMEQTIKEISNLEDVKYVLRKFNESELRRNEEMEIIRKETSARLRLTLERASEIELKMTELFEENSKLKKTLGMIENKDGIIDEMPAEIMEENMDECKHCSHMDLRFEVSGKIKNWWEINDLRKQYNYVKQSKSQNKCTICNNVRTTYVCGSKKCSNKKMISFVCQNQLSCWISHVTSANVDYDNDYWVE